MSENTHSELEAVSGIESDDIEKAPSAILEVIESLLDEVRGLKDELSQYKDYIGREMADVRSNVHSIKESTEGGASEGQNPQGESDEDTAPLVQIAQLPEDLARKELSINQFRAREIAKDVDKYAKRCPKGFVLESSDIKKVLAAKEGERLHNMSVSRVMSFLDRFAEGVHVVKRRGSKKVVFTEELVSHLTRCDGGKARTPANTVILSG